MLGYQEDFIHFCIKNKILRFGEFTLKSGRQSPYFFNAGLFNTGKSLNFLGEVYQKTLQRSKVDFNIIFGPAYKGIPLACATAGAFAINADQDMPWCFNRKEIKDHGEGGQLVGESLAGKKIALVDDVITAGTAIGEVMPLIERAQGTLSVICIALDRQEKGRDSSISAVKKVEESWGVPVVSIISLDDILSYMSGDKTLNQHINAIKDYRVQYGVTAP